jgi:hypothetical protein
LLEPCPVAMATDLVDLEPLGSLRIKIVAWCTSAGRHVRQHGAGVVRPLNRKPCWYEAGNGRRVAYLAEIPSGPSKGQDTTWIGIPNQGGVSGTVATVGVRVGRSLNWTDIVNLAYDTRLRISIRDIAYESLPVDGELMKEPMSSDRRKNGEKGESEGDGRHHSR